MLRQYKQLFQKKKRRYQQVKLSQPENMKTENPNAYWKFWKSFKPKNSTKGPTLSQFVKYFEEQVYPPHVDYFDYDNMKNIIKLVKSSPNDINVKGENGQYDLLQFLNSPITIDDEQCDRLYEKSNIGFEKTRHKFSRLLCFLLYISLKLLSLSIFLFLRVCK